MIKSILDGIKDIVVEISTGMLESCQTIFSGLNKKFANLNVKLMGTYEEIEAFEKAKESIVEAKK